MKFLFLLTCFAGLNACQSNTQKTEQTQQETKATASVLDSVATTEGQKTFFVVTSWTTTDRQKALDHVQNQQKQLMSLWEKGIVEDIYYNQKGEFTDGKPLSLIAFFIKGATEDQVRLALDTTDIVKSNLATYSLRPVGISVFGRSATAMKVASTKGEVYAVVWAFLKDRAKVDTAILREQADLNAKLQQEGILENGRIDLSSFSTQSTGTQSAVYFINAKSETEAKTILDAMPIVKSKQATYGLRAVGQFFAGAKTR